MSSAVAEKEMQEWTAEEKSTANSKYGCEILLERTTLQLAKDPTFPNDAHLIWYNVNGTVYMDLCRCSKKVNMFDMYYDKYGPGAVKKIDFGYGRVSPKLWGYKSPDAKKKR